MLRRLLAAAVVLGALAGCGGSDGDEGPSATIEAADPETTTTSTTEAPTPEEEVEAAYLKSWEIYAEAVRELDDSRLEEAYAGAALETIKSEVARLSQANTPVRCEVDHNYTVDVGGDQHASVFDEYVNHCVLLNGETGEPVEADPNQTVRELYLFERLEDTWKVIGIQEPSQG